MNEEWKKWVAENLRLGCALDETIAILKKNDFTDQSIAQAIADYILKNPPVNPAASETDWEALSRIRITRPVNTMNWEQIPSDKLQLYKIENFMTHQECHTMIKLIKSNLAPSTTGGPQIDKFRTSSTCMLNQVKGSMIQKIDQRISDTIGIHLIYSDIIEGQYYAKGQEFKPHHDYFSPGTKTYENHTKYAGQRTWTFMVYLNTTLKGGGTHFEALNHTFYPQTGTAIAWNNLHADGSLNPNSLHWGMPIEEGEKAIITKWFREKPSVPMILS